MLSRNFTQSPVAAPAGGKSQKGETPKSFGLGTTMRLPRCVYPRAGPTMTSAEISFTQLAMSGSPRLDLCFLSAVTSKRAPKTRACAVIVRGGRERGGSAPRSPRNTIRQDVSSSAGRQHVPAAPESTEPWVGADDRRAETQQWMKRSLLDEAVKVPPGVRGVRRLVVFRESDWLVTHFPR